MSIQHLRDLEETRRHGHLLRSSIGKPADSRGKRQTACWYRAPPWGRSLPVWAKSSCGPSMPKKMRENRMVRPMA